jgi:hypothetical protein
MGKRTKIQILVEKLERLEAKKEDRITKYILPMETEIEKVDEQIKSFYRKQGINI